MKHIKSKKIFESISINSINEYVSDIFEELKDDGFHISVESLKESRYQNRQMKRDELSIAYRITKPEAVAFPKRGNEYFQLDDIKPNLQHALSYLLELKSNRITNVSEVEYVSFHGKGSDFVSDSDWIIIENGNIEELHLLVDIVYLKFRLFI